MNILNLKHVKVFTVMLATVIMVSLVAVDAQASVRIQHRTVNVNSAPIISARVYNNSSSIGFGAGLSQSGWNAGLNASLVRGRWENSLSHGTVVNFFPDGTMNSSNKNDRFGKNLPGHGTTFVLVGTSGDYWYINRNQLGPCPWGCCR